MKFGGHSMIEKLKTVLVRRPAEAFGTANPEKWHYTAKPDYEKANKEHDAFVDILKSEGVTAVYHDVPLPQHADAIFVHDPAIITNYGAIILGMGKHLRKGEEAAIKTTLQKNNIPIFYELKGIATAEGGDMFWLDEKTLAVGRGFRTNQEGIDQLRKVLGSKNIEVLQFDLPYDQGEIACLHLQSLISLLDHNLAAVYLKFFPVSLFEILKKRNFKFVEVPDEEYLTLGPNILAIEPGVCLAVKGNEVTKKRLEQAGCRVLTYVGNEITMKAEGGATCLTRPILRNA